MSHVQDRLDEFKKAFESGAPPYNAPQEAIETMHRATADLKASGLEDAALKVGDRAPSFLCLKVIASARRRVIITSKPRPDQRGIPCPDFASTSRSQSMVTALGQIRDLPESARRLASLNADEDVRAPSVFPPAKLRTLYPTFPKRERRQI